PDARGLIGTQPAYLRTPVGMEPTLPPSVTAVSADGSTTSLGVRWHNVPRGGYKQPGTFIVTGNLGSGLGVARAVVTAYAVDSVEPYSTVVAVGDAPFLPAVATLKYTDGVTRTVPVSWDAVDPSQYASPGSFTVRGTVAGTSIPAIADMRVTADVKPDGMGSGRPPARPVREHVRPADHDQLRSGEHDRGATGHDQSGPGHVERVPADHRASDPGR